MSLVRAIHIAPQVYAGEPGETLEERTFGTRRAAELWAESVLGTIQVTRYNYHRDLQRAAEVRLETRSGEYLGYVSPEPIIVPSVGELGWSP